MIQLTRLNNQPFVVNADLIQFIEKAPDTVITLITGEKVVVREPLEKVVEDALLFRRCSLSGLCAATPAVMAWRKTDDSRDETK